MCIYAGNMSYILVFPEVSVNLCMQEVYNFEQGSRVCSFPFLPNCLAQEITDTKPMYFLFPYSVWQVSSFYHMLVLMSVLGEALCYMLTFD